MDTGAHAPGHEWLGQDWLRLINRRWTGTLPAIYQFVGEVPADLEMCTSAPSWSRWNARFQEGWAATHHHHLAAEADFLEEMGLTALVTDGPPAPASTLTAAEVLTGDEPTARAWLADAQRLLTLSEAMGGHLPHITRRRGGPRER
jgi:hypothetical protein